MNKIKIISSTVGMLFGIFFFVYGGYDDSPGAQLIGFMIFIFGTRGLIKNMNVVIDIELTLNRFGFGKIAENKFQFFCLRFSKWKIPDKNSISFEINWKAKNKNPENMLK